MTTDPTPEFDTSIAAVRTLHERLDAAHSRVKTLTTLLDRLKEVAIDAAQNGDTIPDWFAEFMADTDWALDREIDVFVYATVTIRVNCSDVPLSLQDSDVLYAIEQHASNTLDLDVDSYFHRAVERAIEQLPLGENIHLDIAVDDVSDIRVEL